MSPIELENIKELTRKAEPVLIAWAANLRRIRSCVKNTPVDDLRRIRDKFSDLIEEREIETKKLQEQAELELKARIETAAKFLNILEESGLKPSDLPEIVGLMPNSPDLSRSGTLAKSASKSVTRRSIVNHTYFKIVDENGVEKYVKTSGNPSGELKAYMSANGLSRKDMQRYQLTENGTYIPK